jgi:Beta-propeller repeat
VAGFTESPDFPTLNQFQADQNIKDAFVTKIDTNASGTASLLYSTYLGGSSDDIGRGIAADASGIAYVTGDTRSTDFPTVNQYQTYQTGFDAFVTKLDTNASGTASLLYSTCLGGISGDERAFGIAADASGNAYVTGWTLSFNFPTLHQYQLKQDSGYDAFVTKLDTNASGTASLLYSTYLGGNDWDFGTSIAVDASGHAYVTGYTYSTDFPTLHQYQTYQNAIDAFVTKLDTNASGTASLLYSTYLGGSSFYDIGTSIAVDSAGNAYVTGYTDSTDFPTHNQYQTDQGGTDAFVTKLTEIVNNYSTYLGGTSGEATHDIAVDSAGIAYVTGYTDSPNFPTLVGSQTYQGGADAFVAKIDTNASGAASLLYSAYLGGNQVDNALQIAVDSAGHAYVAGYTDSTDFPLLNPLQTDQALRDAFVAKLDTNVSGASSLLYSTYLGAASMMSATASPSMQQVLLT